MCSITRSLLGAAAAVSLAAAWSAPPDAVRLFACSVEGKAWVVGAKLPKSGLMRQTPGGWEGLGFNHPMITAAAQDPLDPSTLYLAAGNGLIKATEGGRRWRITTGWQVTELRDVAVDPNEPGTVYFSHTAGIQVSRDGAATWQAADHGIRAKYTETIAVDRTRAGRLVAGTENGIYLTADGGRNWRRTGAEGIQIRRVVQSPHNGSLWLAGTEKAGLLRSTDSGLTWESAGDVAAGQNIYDIAFDPARASHVAIAGWALGVLVSEDGGLTWQRRGNGLPRWDTWSVVFDPSRPGRLYASVHEEALYVSSDDGRNWSPAGLENSFIYRLHFFKEPGR